jgi:hypothetical protein
VRYRWRHRVRRVPGGRGGCRAAGPASRL